MVELKRGTQIIYVPTHAEGDIKHSDSERGFVTSSNSLVVFCRYWSRQVVGELRTKMNSESTPIENLVVQNTVPQIRVEAALEKWCAK